MSLFLLSQSCLHQLDYKNQNLKLCCCYRNQNIKLCCCYNRQNLKLVLLCYAVMPCFQKPPDVLCVNVSTENTTFQKPSFLKTFIVKGVLEISVSGVYSSVATITQDKNRPMETRLSDMQKCNEQNIYLKLVHLGTVHWALEVTGWPRTSDVSIKTNYIN